MYKRAAKSSSSSESRGSDQPAEIPRSAGDSFEAATRGGGGDVPFRADMEHAFGQDFSSVRAHLGQGDAMGELGAHAATRGETIAFGSGSPDRELVAHELAHVVQGRQSGAGGGVHAKSIAPESCAAEVEADAVAPRAAAGQRVQLTASLGAGIHLKPWHAGDVVQTKATTQAIVVPPPPAGPPPAPAPQAQAPAPAAPAPQAAPQVQPHVRPPVPTRALPATPQAQPPQAPQAQPPHAPPAPPTRQLEQGTPLRVVRIANNFWDEERIGYELALLTGKKGGREKVILEGRFLREAKRKAKRLAVAEDTIGESGEGISGTAESLEALASYHEHMSDIAADDSDAKSFEQTGLELTMASGGLGSITAGIGGVAAFIGFVHNVRELIEGKDNDKLVDQILGGVRATGNLANAAAAPGSSATSTGRMVTAAVGSVVNNDATKEAMSTFSGIAGGLDAVKGAVTTITDGVATVTGIIKLLNKSEDASGMETFSDGLSTLEGVVRTGMSTISSVNGFLELANVGGTFGASVVPILGPAANIFLKLLMIVHELVDMALKVIDIVRLHKRRTAMAKLRDGDPQDEYHHLYSVLHDVTDHRHDRQILVAITKDLIPILTNMGSVLGSVLQIVGTATAGAYGAGVGLMAGGTAITGAAAVTSAVSGMVPSATKGVHSTRQYLRDVKANEKDGWFADFVRDVHLDRWSKEEKSTGRKNEAYATAVAQLFEVLRDLPKFDGDHKSPKTEIGAEYKHAHVLVRATGVSTKALYRETNLDKMARMLVDALKQRD